ncbi:hypothetical protein [Amycolatopsis sp. DSM 110486]|nr:hypothetical protein [Amycolatopsis sp. DSM 110486]QYN18904.1 hypothetical protein K1T34_40395 [Amycolatopsis sp. DSM 110486]
MSVPTADGFRVAFAVAAAVGALSALLALTIPGEFRTTTMGRCQGNESA